MIQDFEKPFNSTIGGVPPGWYVHEIKIRVFNLAVPGEEEECGKLLTQLSSPAAPEKEQLVSMSVAPRPVYMESGKIFLDITWAVLRPVVAPVSTVTPVTSDRQDPVIAASSARSSFLRTELFNATNHGKPVELGLD